MIESLQLLGLDCETHVIQTQDGYLLMTFRIPTKNDESRFQPVILQHGILGSSADWIDTGRRSLAYRLNEIGYDVWLANARGNTYSKKHVALSEENPKFWNFSFHEMGLYDITALLGYIEKYTNKSKETIYIGHSMGTTMFLVFSSLLPNISKKVKAMVALAPVAFLSHVRSPLRFLAPMAKQVESLTETMGIKELFPRSNVLKHLVYDHDVLNVNKRIWESVMFLVSGFDRGHFDEKLLPVVLDNKPAGTSIKTLLHYAQIIKNDGDFRCFDYGSKEKNNKFYGCCDPPRYTVENVKVPSLLVYAKNDWLATPKDVHSLVRRMSNNPEVYEVPDEKFGHADFLWASNANALVYRPLINFIKKFPVK